MSDRTRALWGRIWPAGLALAALAGAGWWWHSAGRTASRGGSENVLVVGDQRGGLQALLKASGQLEGVPYRVDWALFPAASPLLEALGSGAVDIGGVGGQPFAYAYAGGAKIKVVFAALLDNPPGRRLSAIVVPDASPLKGLADLKGRRLATVRGSAGQDLALQLLEKHGLKASDVRWVYLNNAEAKAALANGAVDAWSTWGPYVAYALQQDRERALADASELPPGAVFEVASDKAIAGKHALIADFLQRIARARRWVFTHKEDYAAVLARETGLPLDVARLTAEQALTKPVPVDERLRLYEQEIFERYQRAGLLDKIPNLDGAFDTSFAELPK